MNSAIKRCTGAAWIVILAMALQSAMPARALAAEPLAKDDIAHLKTLGSKVFNIRWTGKVYGAEERGVRSISDGTTTLTARGTRTFIVHNKKAMAAHSLFPGTDEALQQRGRRILAGIGAQASEIHEMQVLQQATQNAWRSSSGATKLGPVRKERRTLLVSRQIKELAIPSSRLLLNLDAKGNIAFLEVTWPDIAPATLETAQRLQAVAHNDFHAPSVDGAVVDRVQAVVLHSPAVAFYDDQLAALQVSYRAHSEKLGKKPVRYVDAEGRDLVLPRQIEALKESAQTR